jgi:hypothetical protein
MFKPVYRCAVFYRRNKTFINSIVTFKRSQPGFKNLLDIEIVKIQQKVLSCTVKYNKMKKSRLDEKSQITLLDVAQTSVGIVTTMYLF